MVKSASSPRIYCVTGYENNSIRTLALALHFLRSRPLGAALNVLLLSLGLVTFTFLLLVGHQLTKAFERDLAGIDVVGVATRMATVPTPWSAFWHPATACWNFYRAAKSQLL